MRSPVEEFASMSDEEMETAHIQARSTMLTVHAHLPKGVSTSDLDGALNYYIRSSFWQGYANALTHRAVESASHRDPHGRRTLRDAIAKELSRDPDISVLKICRKLDGIGLSARFTYQGKGLLVGPRYAHQAKWADVHDEPCIKMVISRLRRRARREAVARQWVRTGKKVFRGKAWIIGIGYR